MRIGWIGGLTRNEGELRRVAERAGHTLDFHSGEVGGRGAGDLRSVVERADFVVIVTDVNSHGAVHTAKKAARQLDRPTLIIQNFGAARLSRLLEALDRRRQVNVDDLKLASGAR